jgi:non-ribosomal peptide synthase protein (TIGR01720 family)
MVEHRGMVNHLAAKIEDLGIAPGDVVAQTAGVSFDIFVWQLVAALGAGAATAIYDDDTVREPDAQLRALANDRVTIFQIVPSYLGAMLDALEGSSALAELRLRAVSVTGEAVTPALCGRFLERFPAARLLNAYGPTECSDDITHHWVTRADAEALRVPIGRPIHNTAIHIADDRMRRAGVGVTGELIAGGIPVGRGYIGDPIRTAAAFVPDPFSTEPGARMYRTGDLARLRPDGIIEFLGRRDHQVKIRGHRIELGEIDAVLCSFDSVRDAVTVLAKAQGVPPRLVAFVIAEGSASELSEADLRVQLSTKVTPAMVPSRIAVVDALPLTRNGKIDRKQLERWSLDLSTATAAESVEEAPRDAKEAAVRDVFGVVLGATSVGRGDNFFDLGGDSILSLQVVSKLRQRGFRVTAKDVFQHQTVADLAEHLTRSEEKKSAAFEGGKVELAPVQRRFFDMPGEGKDRWNLGVRVRLQRELDIGELEAAAPLLLSAHPLLRTRFSLAAGGIGFEQIVDAEGRAAVLAVPAGEAGVDLLCRQITLEGAKLALGLTASRRDELLVVAHHLVTDAVSLQVIVDDLLSILDGDTNVQHEETHFAGWLGALRDVRTSPSYAEEASFWRESVERASRTGEIPVDQDVIDREGGRAHLTRSLDRSTTEALLDKLRDDFRIHPLEALAASLAAALGGWMPEQATLWLEGHGRDDLDERVDLTRSVGWFTSIYPVTLPQSDDRAQRLRAAKEAIRAVPRGGAGFTAYELAVEGALPKLGVTLNFLGDLDRNAGQSPLLRSVEPLIAALRAPECGRMEVLDVAGYVSGGELQIVVSHGARHSAATIEAILDRLFVELDQLAKGDAVESADVVVASDFSATMLTDEDLAALRAHLDSL